MKRKYIILFSLLIILPALRAQEKMSILADTEVASFDDISLDEESYWNGEDGSGAFVSGPVRFFNSYNAEWFSWSGWAYSNISDTLTTGWINQYSAITGQGVAPKEGNNYGISYTSPPSGLVFTDGSAHELEGMYVSNSTYTALSMRNGDDFTKKFGGPDGNDEDWFSLSVTGYLKSEAIGTIEFYLADFRFEDPEEDYIADTWEWVDLNELGKVDSLTFSLSSSDNGEWGMNTPAYFVMDDLSVFTDRGPMVAFPIEDISDEPGRQLEIDLSGVFTDVDDEDSAIVLSLRSNEKIEVAHAWLDKHILNIDLLAEGSTKIVLEALSNNKTVEDSINISVIATGLHAMESAAFLPYPNPTDGSFRIASGYEKYADLTIFDVSGRVVFQNNQYMPGTIIDIRDRPPGNYLLKLQHKHGVVRQTIIKR